MLVAGDASDKWRGSMSEGRVHDSAVARGSIGELPRVGFRNTGRQGLEKADFGLGGLGSGSTASCRFPAKPDNR